VLSVARLSCFSLRQRKNIPKKVALSAAKPPITLPMIAPRFLEQPDKPEAAFIEGCAVDMYTGVVELTYVVRTLVRRETVTPGDKVRTEIVPNCPEVLTIETTQLL
jgi:hypothetical protein